MRLIDADALTDRLCSTCVGRCAKPCCEWELIVVAPTVDAVEVVRCKDCKHFRSETFKSGMVATWCHLHSGWDYEQDVKPYDYCSDGERREDGESE